MTACDRCGEDSSELYTFKEEDGAACFDCVTSQEWKIHEKIRKGWGRNNSK